jgi:hypothetical protein
MTASQYPTLRFADRSLLSSRADEKKKTSTEQMVLIPVNLIGLLISSFHDEHHRPTNSSSTQIPISPRFKSEGFRIVGLRTDGSSKPVISGVQKRSRGQNFKKVTMAVRTVGAAGGLAICLHKKKQAHFSKLKSKQYSSENAVVHEPTRCHRRDHDGAH